VLENQIKSDIGGDRGIESPIAKVLWTQAKDSEKVDWEGFAEDVSALLMQSDPGARERLDAARAKRTTVRPGSRRFTVTEK
jgi:hypothetical protein